MPLFEYQCNNCNHVTTFLEKAGSKKQHPCEECGSTNTAKKLSTFAPQMKARSSAPSANCQNCPTGSCPFSQS